jgi:hypothetical protein
VRAPRSALNRDHVTAGAIVEITRARGAIIDRIIGHLSRWESPPRHSSPFGSFARGDADNGSDIDVLVVLSDASGDDPVSGSQAAADDLTAAVRRWTGNDAHVVTTTMTTMTTMTTIAEMRDAADPLLDSWLADHVHLGRSTARRSRARGIVTRAGSRVAPATPEAARTRRSQARAFLDVAELVLDEPATRSETHVAAALAVLAAIAAADAIRGLRLGHYSRGQDHRHAVDLLATVDLPDRSLPTEFGRILAAKDNAHYSPRLVSASDTRALVIGARALVEASERLGRP